MPGDAFGYRSLRHAFLQQMDIEVEVADPEGVGVRPEDAESTGFVEPQGCQIMDLHIHLKHADLPQPNEHGLGFLEQCPAVSFSAYFRNEIHAVNQTVGDGEGVTVTHTGHAHQIGTLKDA